MKQETAAASSVPTLPDEITLGAVLREPTRKPVYLRVAGWCLVVGCALSMGAILASTPQVTQKLSSWTNHVPAATQVDTATLTTETVSEANPDTQNPEFTTDGTPLAAPGKLMSALGALSRSARSALGYGDPMDYVELPTEENTDPSEGGFSAFFASDEDPVARPAVSAMPQNRIPIRRAGVSN
ncbi:hypothetical protein QEZ52_03695 [Aliisedimentitalea scapharcae]|uniref:Uncharacterized protein n=1 Tax=Aliisedimentitalea scapharcae TaxID=1524259 RepID=A0ABZ2XU97_9RHOB|nr:hypothetical protein K3727_19740 [Rhodobacteraceae bacterium M382]